LAVTKLSMGTLTSWGIYNMMMRTPLDDNGDPTEQDGVIRPLITGNGPKSRSQQRIWQQMGIPKWSVWIDDENTISPALPGHKKGPGGGRYIKYNTLDPVGQLLGQTVGTLEIMNGFYTDREREEGIFAISAALGEYMSDKAYMQGIAEIMDTIGGNRSYTDLMARKVGSLVPGWLDDIRETVDTDESGAPILRDKRGGTSITDRVFGVEDNPFGVGTQSFLGKAANYMIARVPGLSDNLPPKIDPFGNEVVLDETGWFGHALSPIEYSMVNHDDIVANELFEQGYGWMEPDPVIDMTVSGSNLNARRGKSTVGFGPNSATVELDLFEIEPSGELFREYAILVGKARYNAVAKLIRSDAYKRLAERGEKFGSGRLAALRSASEAAGRRAKEQFFKKWGSLLGGIARQKLSAGESPLVRPTTGSGETDVLEPTISR